MDDANLAPYIALQNMMAKKGMFLGVWMSEQVLLGYCSDRMGNNE